MGVILKSKLPIIGRKEIITIKNFDNILLEAKIDTGARTTSLYAINMKVANEVLYFELPFSNNQQVEFSNFQQLKVKSSNGQSETRYAVKLKLKLANRIINTLVTLSNRGEMNFPLLIGRRFLKNKFMVDVSKQYVYSSKLKDNLKNK